PRATPRRCASGRRCARRRSNDGGGRPTHKRGVRCARVLALGAADPVRACGGRGGRGGRSGGQALALVRGRSPGAGHRAAHPLPRPRADLEHRHQLRLVPPAGAIVAGGAAGAPRNRRGFAVGFAVADDLAARRGGPRPPYPGGGPSATPSTASPTGRSSISCCFTSIPQASASIGTFLTLPTWPSSPG